MKKGNKLGAGIALGVATGNLGLWIGIGVVS